MKRPITALSVGALIVSSAAVAPVGTAQADPREATSPWSNAQLVDGIVFGEGPVAEEIGVVSQLDPATPSEATEAARTVEAGLREQMLSAHADSVAMAVDLVTSGDPYDVEEGQSVLADTFRTSVDEAYPQYSANVMADTRCGAIAACVLGAVLAVVAGVAVAVVAEAGVVGHAAVYATQALWERNAVFGKSAPASTTNASVPDFSVAEMNARITSKLATR